MADPSSAAAAAAAAREEGNAHANSRRPAKAVDCYTLALSFEGAVSDPHVLLSNRASQLLLLPGRAEEAAADALRATALAPSWSKGHFRLGAALEHLKRFDEAAAAYARAAELDPSSKDVATALARARRAAEAVEATRPPPSLADCVRIAEEEVRPEELLAAHPDASISAALLAAAAAAGADAASSFPVRVEVRPGRGRCLVATRDIPALSLVLHEAALAWYPNFATRRGGAMPGLLEWRGKAATAGMSPEAKARALDRVYAGLLHLAPHAPEASATESKGGQGSSSPSAPHSPPSPRTRADILLPAAAHNALGATFDEDASPREHGTVLLLCPLVDMANNSCSPTCAYVGVWDAAAQAPAMRLVAERDVRAGEELTIAYVNRADSKEQRLAKLREGFGFTCTCARCAAPHDDAIVLRCGACGTGRVYSGASACADCGAAVSPEEVARLEAAAVALLVSAAEDPVALADAVVGVPVGGGSGAGGGPSPPPTAPLHPSDQRFLSTLYRALPTVWTLPSSAARARLLRALASSPGLVPVRGPVFSWDLLLACGHAHTIDGQREAAKGDYAAAAAQAAALFGESSPQAAVCRACLARPPLSAAEVGKVERKRVETCGSWLGGPAQGALPKKIYDRWVRPVDLSDPAKNSRAVEDSLVRLAAAALKGVRGGAAGEG
jgi:tetratricopeptide (TPR) repeat protein